MAFLPVNTQFQFHNATPVFGSYDVTPAVLDTINSVFAVDSFRNGVA